MDTLVARIFCGALVLALSGCARPAGSAAEQLTGGNAHTGQHLIYAYGCGSCHVIPGIAEANGAAGPPLDGFGSRVYIAGSLTNEPNHLVTWIVDPQRIVPGNAMPALGVTEAQARDMAAYLYTLR